MTAKAERMPFELVNHLPKLQAGADEEQVEQVALLARANAYSAAMIIGGVLFDEQTAGDPTEVRFDEIIDELSETTIPDPDDVGEKTFSIIDERAKWAYRLGLTVGLRLARALPEGGAR